jgi:gamma-D-glutamyl-L-lysine dipeptidyl-peptidase
MADSVGEHTFDYQSVGSPAALRAEPRADAEQVAEALPGEPLERIEERGGWTLVRTAYGYPGWLRSDSLDGEPDAGWLEARAASPLQHARTLLGAPYLWGGLTARGVDCSGLVHLSYRATGRLVPRDADQQEAAGIPVELPEPGDLISYGDAGGADHIAFWLGDGRILHASGRDGIRRVVEEAEPRELRARRRAAFRL